LVLLDPGDPGVAGGRELLAELCEAAEPVATLLVTRRGGKVDRAEAARLGCVGYVEKPVPATKVMAVVRDLLSRRNPRSTVLVVAADPAVVSPLYALGDRGGLRVEQLREPERFWHMLELVRPELVVLDEDLPALVCEQVCHMVRADPTWRRLPIVVVTGRPAVEHRELYRIGADDVVSRAAAGDDLGVRVSNRLGRTGQVLPAGDADPGTGLVGWPRFEWDMRRLLGLARRYGQPVAVAVFVVDGVEALGRYGPQAAGAAFAALGRLLQRSFRFEDTVGVHDDQVVAGLYGADPTGTRERIATLLETFRHEQIAVGGDWLRATASAGMAMFPIDGGNVAALTDAATAALQRSIADGGDRITCASDDQPRGEGAVDVLVVDDDDALAALLLHALSTRGYRTHRLADGAEATALLLAPDGLRARVILLDVGLPGLDGLSVLRELAHRQVLAHTRVIMVTMRSSEREVLQALELGAFDHVAKPLSVPLLLHRVRQALESLPS
jgi:DNA-binding response OmpR family regulator